MPLFAKDVRPFSLKNFCRLASLFYTAWSFANLLFYLAAFTSPKLNVLVAYHLLPERVDAFGRAWFALACCVFWAVHIVVDALLFVGIQKRQVRLFRPFCVWTTIGIFWELSFIVLQLINYDSPLQMLGLSVTLVLDVLLPVYFLLLVHSYATYIRLNYDEREKVVLENTGTSATGFGNTGNGKRRL